MRTCTICGEEKPSDAFHGEPRVKDGLAAACRSCVKASRKGRHKPGRIRSGSAEQTRARGKVRDAVRYGKIIKPDRCEQCGEITPRRFLDGHHEDYSKPLDVIWLCRSCHGLRADGGVEGHAYQKRGQGIPEADEASSASESGGQTDSLGAGIKPGPSEAPSTHGKPDGAVRALLQRMEKKLAQLRDYREHDCQLDHARTIADGRIAQLELDISYVNADLAALSSKIAAAETSPGDALPLGDLFNALVRRMNWDGMDPRSFTLGELEGAIDGAKIPK